MPPTPSDLATKADHGGPRDATGMVILLGALGMSIAVWAVLVLGAFLLIG